MNEMRILLIVTTFIYLSSYARDTNASESNMVFHETFSVEGVVNSKDKGLDLPDGWEKLTFPKIKNETNYEVLKELDNFVLKAKSENSASGMAKKLAIDLKKYPIISWRWKVSDVLKGGDATKKSGDDYPARIYITFEYNPETTAFWERVKYRTAKAIYGDVPASVINYIWANKLKKGTYAPNVYTDKVVMFAVESGNSQKGKWLRESRNLYEDYKMAFGKEPPLAISIAVMTDTDNTGESVEAYYDDIIFSEIAVKY